MNKKFLYIVYLILLVACGQQSTSGDECSQVEYYAPESTEAQQIAMDFATDFRAQWPTEYMAFEQLWGVYQMGGYVVIEGMVTQESVEIIIAQQTPDGYRMVARYTRTMPHSAEEIREILLQQASEVPSILYQCIDLSRFGEQDTVAIPTNPPSLAPPTHSSPGPVYETVFQIPVGEGGIRYQGLRVEEMQVTGPNGLAVLPDGTFIIADPLDNRLLHYGMDGSLLGVIDLYDLSIVNVSDIIAASTELYLLEISFNVAPERFRVNRLSFEGELIAQYEIPQGCRFEDGLYGLGPAEGTGVILLELYGEVFRYCQIAGALDTYTGEIQDIHVFGWMYRVMYGSSVAPITNPAILADGLRVESQMTLGGMIKILAVNPDGSFYVYREDLVRDYPTGQGDITIHFTSAEGEQLGAARYPIVEWLYFVQRHVAVGPDGNVYALLPREDSVDILRLNFFPRLDPLISGAVEPYVGRVHE